MTGNGLAMARMPAEDSGKTGEGFQWQVCNKTATL
jgi:hypothetical protein